MNLKISKKRYDTNCHHLEHLARKLGANMTCNQNGDTIEMTVSGPEESLAKLKQKLGLFGAK